MTEDGERRRGSADHLKRVEAAGGTTVFPATEVMEGTVIGQFADPEGHVAGLLQARQ